MSKYSEQQQQYKRIEKANEMDFGSEGATYTQVHNVLFNDPMPDIDSEQQQLSPLKTCHLTQVRQDGKITQVCMCIGGRRVGYMHGGRT